MQTFNIKYTLHFDLLEPSEIHTLTTNSGIAISFSNSTLRVFILDTFSNGLGKIRAKLG
jgi:hypothetical protein